MSVPRIVNIEENITGNTHEHVVTYDKPVTVATFKDHVQNEAYFGYHPSAYGGAVRAVTDQGELIEEYTEGEQRQTWAWLHRAAEEVRHGTDG